MLPVEEFNQACPKTAAEIKQLPSQPDVHIAAKRFGVQKVVHFTTLNGVIGIFAVRAVKSRYRLSKENYLEYVYEPNVELRKDPEWLDYVNLSIERINDWMFDTSQRWHANNSTHWVVLSFDTVVLEHPGVVFTTTNNIYPACTRDEGLVGFERMFANTVKGRYGMVHDRSDKPTAWPTDRQAEVLYPGELSCEYLRRIDVQTEENVDAICGIWGGLISDKVSVCCTPEVFE